MSCNVGVCLLVSFYAYNFNMCVCLFLFVCLFVWSENVIAVFVHVDFTYA